MVSGSTNIPPLKAASGADNFPASTIIFIPRGGRPLVTANLIPAAVNFSIAALARGVIRFWLSTSVPSTSARRIEIFFEAIRSRLVELRKFIKALGRCDARSQEPGDRIPGVPDRL